MTASKERIAKWFDDGVMKGATHMVVVCDTFDHEDYPVYAYSQKAARLTADKPGKMQRVMEVYSLAMDRASQLAVRKAWNF